jgi:poly(A) polymerase
MTCMPFSNSLPENAIHPFADVPNSTAFEFAKSIVQRLVDQRHLAYFAGGCVRDFVMGTIPSDYDVATTATPSEILEIFGPRKTLAIGEAFGVMCVHEKRNGVKHSVEVATFRRDGSYSDGRRPDNVEFTTPEGDAQRRDFTINGLFYDPLAKHIIDFVGGLNDIKTGQLRAIGDPIARFTEDKLRLLRAIRFAARFGSSLDKRTEQAIIAMADQLTIVSPERIGVELRKMLAHPSRRASLQWLHQLGLLNSVFPELHLFLESDDQKEIVLKRVASLARNEFESGLAILMASLVDDNRNGERTSKLLEALQDRWRLSNDEISSIRFATENYQLLLQADQLKWSKLQPVLISPFIETAMAVAASWMQSEGMPLDPLERCRSKLSLPTDQLNPEPVVDGRTLMELGVPTGPIYSQLIRAGRAAQLDGEIMSRDDGTRWVKEKLSKL